MVARVPAHWQGPTSRQALHRQCTLLGAMGVCTSNLLHLLGIIHFDVARVRGWLESERQL